MLQNWHVVVSFRLLANTNLHYVDPGEDPGRQL